MYKVYLKQAISMLKENKLLSTISILGTALAIAMIMVIVIVWQVRTANYAPEDNRSRILSVKEAKATAIKNNTWNSYQRPSLRVIKEVFYPLKEAEAVTMTFIKQRLVSTPDETVRFKNDLLYTDGNFWTVFRFKFINGLPYAEEEVLSGIQRAVVSETTARRLYGSTDVIGKTVLVGYIPYSICGVVEDVSLLAESAYANIWLPYTTDESHLYGEAENLLGSFSCYILAPNSGDFDQIKKEIEENVKRLNDGQAEWVLSLIGGPDTQLERMSRVSWSESPNVNKWLTKYIIILVIILLIPAINMSGMTLSRMRKRMAEVGVRKAFGASRTTLVNQILYENMFLTLLGGILGLVVSYMALFVLQDWLLQSSISPFASGTTFVKAGMIFNPVIFGSAFLFCLLMNLLSAGVPAWRASSMNIIDAINEK